MPEDRDYWDEEESELVALFPLRVHRRHGEWYCTCMTFDRTGKCRHLVPFRRKEDVEVKEEYL